MATLQAYLIFRPEEHGSEEHAKIRKDYIKWMKRKLEFKPRIQEKVIQTFESIARKLDFRPSQVTYIGMHNRRSKEFNEFFKKQNNSLDSDTNTKGWSFFAVNGLNKVVVTTPASNSSLTS